MDVAGREQRVTGCGGILGGQGRSPRRASVLVGAADARGCHDGGRRGTTAVTGDEGAYAKQGWNGRELDQEGDLCVRGVEILRGGGSDSRKASPSVCFRFGGKQTSGRVNGPISVPAGVEFPALETLSLSCFLPDLDSFIPCCPRLRTLRLGSLFLGVLRLNSVSLQELVVDREAGLTDHISIVAPVLRQLTMSFISSNPSISVSAPMLEKVSWRCCYTDGSIVFGVWLLEESSSIFHGEVDTLTQEIEKHMIAEFSVLELHLKTSGHVFGALTIHLLGMNRLCTAMQKIKVILQRSAVKERCSPDCPCESSGWRVQTISLTALEEVEINGFEGDNHELDFLKLVLRCAPMLKRMIVKLSDKASASNYRRTKLYNIFRANSSVEFYVYLSSGPVKT
uniref:Uncharacterized protein n=1 Tax=Aegilops tauschii TaxID=37682 RepID=N1R1V3_AEGTA